MPGGSGAVDVVLVEPASVAPVLLDDAPAAEAPLVFPLVFPLVAAPVVPPPPVELPPDEPPPDEPPEVAPPVDPPPVAPDNSSCKPLVSNDW